MEILLFLLTTIEELNTLKISLENNIPFHKSMFS